MAENVKLNLRVQVAPWAKWLVSLACAFPLLSRPIGADRLGRFIARYGVRITRADD